MFAKKLLQKATQHHHHHQVDEQSENLKQEELKPQILCHIGVPNTASILAVDPIQQLIAIGTLDGRIKIIGGDNIDGLLVSPKQLPYKNLKFLQNQGYLIGILNDNDIQVWHLESRSIVCSLQWEADVTAFSVITGSLFMLVGDEYGRLSILMYAPEDGKLVDMPYCISPNIVSEKTGLLFSNDQPVVGVLPQPSCFGDRLVIAYQYGSIILWDVVEADIVAYKGDKNLRIKGGQMADSPAKLDTEQLDSEPEDINEKEISALCWASSVGSMLAVAYTDGDILLWSLPRGASSESKNTGVSCNDVVKLQLSSSGKRLPVIVLHWCETSVSQNSCGGQLFVYGGCEIGLEEVITVVSLEWSPGMETLRSVRRVDLALNGAFADIALLSSFGAAAVSPYDGLFMLTRPGKLCFYDMDKLSALSSQQERKCSASGTEYPVAVPTSDPQMTATRLCLHGNSSVWLAEMGSVGPTLHQGKQSKWPLTGGMHSELSSVEEKPQRIYITGYQDGSVRVWNATNPTLLLVSVLEGQVHGIGHADINTSVTKLDFCGTLMSLAVGSESGMVRIYSLNNSVEVTKLHWVKNLEHQVHDVPPRKGPQCRACFSLVNSAVQSLQFSVSGDKLAVGFESGHVAVLDMLSLSVLFVKELVASSGSPVISLILRSVPDFHSFSKSPKHSGTKDTEQPLREILITLTQDAKVNVLDFKTGSTIATRPLNLKKQHTAISMYFLEGSKFITSSSSEHHGHKSSSEPQEESNKKSVIPDESKQDVSPRELRGKEHSLNGGESISDSLFLLCCENVLRVYHMKSVVQGDDNPVCKVTLASGCCWTSYFRKDDKRVLVLGYKSGSIELRSLPSLKLLTESSLFTVLRWNYRPKMEKLACYSSDGLISLVDGSEVAFFSLYTAENETRSSLAYCNWLPESLPLLHDKVVAAAADAAISYSLKQKKQVAVSGVLGNLTKGFKKAKSDKATKTLSSFLQLEEIFSRPIVPDSTVVVKEEDEDTLDIDDIEIDDPVFDAAAPSYPVKGKTAKSHRESLLESNPKDMKPRTRTPEEIMAAYKGTEYASAAAERAKNKLLERQEKLERINQRTEDLRHEAEDFASMANELVKTMERKKWWKI